MKNTLLTQIIEQSFEDKNPFLDLGNCGLTELPEVLTEMWWVEELMLGVDYFNGVDREYVETQNFGNTNQIDFNSEINNKILRGMSQLVVICLGGNGIVNTPFLTGLKRLKRLYLDGNEISDIASLITLTELNSLDLSANNVKDYSTLRKLENLNYLNLGFSAIADTSFFLNLRQLQTLIIHECEMTNFDFIQNLKELSYLELGDNQINNIMFLEKLNQLDYLDLSYNQIENILSLKKLEQLDYLDLSYNQIEDVSVLQNLKNLSQLFMKGNPIQHIPKEIYDQMNCATDLHNYWRELESSQKTTNTQLKIMFLGNGCTGKTTLLHWFIDNEFKDIGLESRTHGIFIKPLKLCKDAVLGNFWDFGGQEVYHATHRLFLGRRTLYILVWATETPETENELRHPPQYWLDMIADLPDKGERSRVLIVQNLFDNQIEQNVLTDEELKNYAARGLDITRMSVDAKEGDNIDAFKTSVESNAKKLLDKYKEELPETWVNIRTKVAERRENKEKTLTFADFEQICVDCKLVGTPSVILGYLHRAGEVFYYPNQFDNQIILDQEWALKAVYAVLKNTNKEQFNRPFKLNLLIDIWQKEDNSLSVEDAKIFLNFMLSNQIMFSTEAHSFGEKEAKFVIPQLLTDTLPMSAKSNKNRQDSVIHRIDYAFLHRDIIERFIVHTAQFSKDKEYWKNGIFIEFNNAFAIVEVLKENDKNKINIECFGTNKDHLLQKIREEFNKIRTLDKATEYQFVNDNWQLITAKLDPKDVEKSGFETIISAQLNTEIESLVREIMQKTSKNAFYTEGSLKSELHESMTKGKLKDVLNRLIELNSNDSEEQNKARLHLIRIKNNEDENNKGTITHTLYSTELNRINAAVLDMINDLEDSTRAKSA